MRNQAVKRISGEHKTILRIWLLNMTGKIMSEYYSERITKVNLKKLFFLFN